MISVYCIRRAGEPPPPEGLLGPDGTEVRLIEEGPLGVWVSSGEGLTATTERARAHDDVVRCALRSATPLPARFGTAFSDVEELLHSLRERRDILLESLLRVEGRVEMGVRVEWSVIEGPGPTPPVESGRGYLEARRGELAAQEALRSRAAALLDKVEARMAPEGWPAVSTLLPSAGVAASMAHLVHRHDVATYRGRVEEARSDLLDVVLRVTGPWAPYSFV